MDLENSTPDKIYVHNFWPPKKIEIQKVFVNRKSGGNINFRCSVQIFTVLDGINDPIYPKHNDFSTPKCCDLIDVIPNPTYSGIDLPTAVYDDFDYQIFPVHASTNSDYSTP